MRKADYLALAFAIGENLNRARQVCADGEASEHDRTCALGAIAALKSTAQCFVHVASVDREAFLKACGIE